MNRYAITACAVALVLAGCGGSQASIGTPRALPQSAAIVAHVAQSKSWMRPEARSKNLLYVADGQIYVFSYPSGTLVGTIADDFVNGICSDKSGNVFAVDGSYARIVEYRHGSLTPSATLHFPQNDHQPLDCAVDPDTGNLAVTIAPSSNNAGIAIFAAEKGPPKYYYYSNYNAWLWECVYDSGSNLFAAVSLGNSLWSELPKGGSKLQDLKLKGSGGFRAPTPIQWDGTYLTVGNQTGSSTFTLYRLKLKGTSLSVVGRSMLNAYGVGSIWFEPQTLIGTSSSGVSLWKYPAGGNPFLTVQGTAGAGGVTVSLAPK